MCLELGLGLERDLDLGWQNKTSPQSEMLERLCLGMFVMTNQTTLVLLAHC